MSNKSNGTAFEKEFARMLAGHDFWVHCIRDNANGQLGAPPACGCFTKL